MLMGARVAPSPAGGLDGYRHDHRRGASIVTRENRAMKDARRSLTTRTGVRHTEVMIKNIREIVLREVGRRRLTGYALGTLVAPHVARRTVQAYLAGSRDMTSDLLGYVLDALELKIVPKRRRKTR